MTLEYPPDRGGVVQDPRFWESSAGYEFWLNFGNADMVTVMASTNDGLSGYGWTNAIAANAAITEGSTGDLLSSADVDPTRLVRGSTNLSIRSPRVFGSYDHALIAARFLGALPTSLSMECFAKWATATANETTTFFGLHTPGGTDASAAGCAGGIASNGTNFVLVSDLSTDAGAAVDNAWHKWKIIWASSTTEWFIDDSSQGTITTETDIWPLSWAAVDGTTNRIEIAWARMFYSL